MESFVGTEIIEFSTGEGLIWNVDDYVSDKDGWRLVLRADEGGTTFEQTLPVRDCFLFTPGTTARAERVDVKKLRPDSRVFVEARDCYHRRGAVVEEIKDGHLRGTVMKITKTHVWIKYDKCEAALGTNKTALGGKTKKVQIEDVLFDISAAIQERKSTSCGPLFRKGEWIVTDQEWKDGDRTIGSYRSTVLIESIDLEELWDSKDEERVNGQVGKRR